MPCVRRQHPNDPAELGQSVGDQGRPPGCRSGRPHVHVVPVAPMTGLEVEQDASEFDTSQSIGQAVVDHLEHCDTSVRESVDEPDFP